MTAIARGFDGCLWIPNDIESFHLRDFIKKYHNQTIFEPEILELVNKSPKIVKQILDRMHPLDDKRYPEILKITPYEKGWYIQKNYQVANKCAFILPIKNLVTHSSNNFKNYFLQNFVCIGIFNFIE